MEDISVYEMHNKIRDEILKSYDGDGNDDDDGDDYDYECNGKKAQLASRSWFRSRSISSSGTPNNKSGTPLTAHHQPGLLRFAGKLSWFTATVVDKNDVMNNHGMLQSPEATTTPSSKAIMEEPAVQKYDFSEKSKTMSVLLNKSTNIRNVYREKLRRPSSHMEHSNRVIIISGIPKDFGINMVLSQVCGGPLEQVMMKSQELFNTLKLCYIFAADARLFYEYAHRSGQFQFHGITPSIEWANPRNIDDYIYLEPLPRYLIHQVTNLSSRRVLILTKKVLHKKTRSDNRLYYPNPATHLSVDFDIKDVKHDFSAFGEVLEIGSVVSRKLCFSVHYADIRSAIIAKSECDTEDSVMHKKYSQWKIWFSKDITDKPCHY